MALSEVADEEGGLQMWRVAADISSHGWLPRGGPAGWVLLGWVDQEPVITRD
jgi:hypothetical protein